PTCGPAGSRGAGAGRSRPGLCAGDTLEAERQQIGRVAPDSDHAGSGVSTDHRAERLDHQSLGDRFELPRHALGIRLGVGVPDDHTQSLAAIQRARHFNDTVECAVESAHPLERGDEAVSDAEHRLPCSTDPSSALARPMRPPRLRNSRVATEKYVCTCSRMSFTLATTASAPAPCATSSEAASVSNPSDIEASCESITCTRFASVISAPCTADA